MALFARIAHFDGPEIAFILDGRPVSGQPGESLLAAILRHRDHLLQHEAGGGPRAGFCLMGACQECWVQVGPQRRARACTTRLQPGMAVATQLTAQGDDLA